MKQVILSIVAGAALGFVFRALKLPLPAPSVLAGVIGILGVYLGGQLFDVAIKYFA